MGKKQKRILLIIFLSLTIAFAAAVITAYMLITHRVKGDTFNADGVRIHYTVEGKGEPVILLHGFAVNADLNFRRPGITQELTKEYRVISMDMRGHGLSGKPHDEKQYGVEMANDVIRLMDHLKIEKAHLVGYSLGGFAALKLATTHPERFITVAPLGAGWEDPDKSDFLKAMPQLEKDLKSGKGIGPLSGKLDKKRKKPGLMHTVWVRLMTGYFNDKEALIAMIRAVPDLAVQKQELKKIPMPVLSVVGGEDNLRAGAEAMVGAVPNHTLVIVEGADHMKTPFSDEMQDALFDFLHKHSTE